MGLEFHVCTINKSAHTKKSGNLFNDYRIFIVGRVFATGPEDRGSSLGRVILKIKKMLLDAALLNTHLYKVQIKGKENQSKESSSALHYNSV